MAVALEVLNQNERGGEPEVHIAGCADVKRTVKRGGANRIFVDTFRGETIIEALVALDIEWASSFGVDDPYSQEAYDNGCWSHRNMVIAPCARPLMKGITYADEFGGHTRPLLVVAERKYAAPEKPLVTTGTPAPVADGAKCQCGCGGQPKGKKARYLPGHDTKHRAALLAKARLASAKRHQLKVDQNKAKRARRVTGDGPEALKEFFR